VLWVFRQVHADPRAHGHARRTGHARAVLTSAGGAGVAAGSTIVWVSLSRGAGAVAARLAAEAVAIRPGARGVTFRICGMAFAAVTALKDAEIVEVHVLVGVEPGVGTG